jgi:hypothetical protein
MDSFWEIPKERFINGKQWHLVSYIGGPRWAQPGVRKPTPEMINYIKKVNNAGGVVTMEMTLYRDGSLNKEQLSQLISIRKAIKTDLLK